MKILLLILAMFINLNANAMEGGFGQTITSIDEPIEHEVTVGEVDASLGTYDIEITWDSFVFDYVYDESTDSYKWMNYTGNPSSIISVSNKNYVNFPINVYAVWESTTEYDFVKGIIKEDGSVCHETEYKEEEFNAGLILTGEQCNANPNYSYNDPNHSYDPDKYYSLGGAFKYLLNNKVNGYIGDPIEKTYSIELTLENDPTKEAKTPKTGDKIGTFTITFEAEEPNGQ